MPSDHPLHARALDGIPLFLDVSHVVALRSAVRGTVLTPDDEGYDAARTVWNAMVDSRPAVIVRCRGAADVLAAVRFAIVHGLLTSIRGGGHNVAGTAVCDGGLMIDLSPMKGIRVDPARRVVRAEAGVLWAELDAETTAFGLATTGGTVSSTGIAGLTLGGGIGWLGARHGLACDNLLSVDIVTMDGQLVTASRAEHQDLFWALRGGGGNFGVATAFEFALHPIPPAVTAGMILHPLADAGRVLAFYREFSRSTGDDLTAYAGLMTLPDGTRVVAIVAAWFGAPADAAARLAPLRTFGSPLADTIAPIPYRQLQSMFDAAAPHGLRRYWKSGFVPDLSDEMIARLVDAMAACPSPYTVIMIFHIHGRAAGVAPDATAFGARATQWDIDIIPQWTSPADDDALIGWARDTWKAVEPFTASVYVNHLDRDDRQTRVRTAYGANFARLQQIKRRYDPANRLRMNANITPAE